MHTNQCLYCHTPWADSSMVCRNPNCPSKLPGTHQYTTYCVPPCKQVNELDAMFKEHINKYHFIQYPPKTAKPTPTDEELVEKYQKLLDFSSEEGEDTEILRQLIKEIRS